MKRGGVVLPPLSALYGAAIRARLAAYARGLLPVSKLPRPVISIGNLTAGGTGKTPLVEWISRALASDGKKVCVLTRGYKRERPKERVLVSDGKSLQASEPYAGDEPFLLAEQLLGIAAVISDVNRHSAGMWAIENLGTDAFVLDDGFQHLQLGRDLNILVIDATDPWGNGELLPAGRLREPRSGASRADCTVITRTNEVTSVETLAAEISDLTSHRPVFTSRLQVRSLQTLAGGAAVIGSARQVTAFCGVGNPGSFFRQLQSAGFDLAHSKRFPDHHRYTQSDIDALCEAATSSGAEVLITTAKDAVKLTTLQISLPCYVLAIEMNLDNEEVFRNLLRSVY